MKHVAFAVLAGVLWGVGEVCTRSALHSGRVGPISAITVRSLIAIPVVLAVFFLMTRGVAGLKAEPALQAMDGASWLKIGLGSGLLAGGMAMVCFYIALSLGEVSVVKPIAFSIAPAVGVVLGWLVLGEELTPRKIAALVLIVAGVVILTTGGGKHVAPDSAQATGRNPPSGKQ